MMMMMMMMMKVVLFDVLWKYSSRFFRNIYVFLPNYTASLREKKYNLHFFMVQLDVTEICLVIYVHVFPFFLFVDSVNKCKNGWHT